MIRSDKLGVTSVIRDLALRHDCYETMMHFFRADSWSLDSIIQYWYNAVQNNIQLYKESGRVILIGDGVKQAKEGRHMPAVKKLFQNSEDSSKAQYIFGHMFGGIGILAGSASKWFCIPLRFNIQDGLQDTVDWKGSAASSASHVIQVIENAYHAACTFGNSLLLLDRYFLTAPALKKLTHLNSDGDVHMHIVTKAKRSCTAYEYPVKRAGRGRPAIKGRAVKLMGLFDHKEEFTETEIFLYGKKEKVRYFTVNLLWGQKLYQELRFVLVEYKGARSILVSTDTGLDPLVIIRLYSRRFQIECTFREFKQQTGGFCYRFWTRSMPKLNHFQKKTDRAILESVTREDDRKKILRTVRATECFVQLSVIAMGILQIASLKFSDNIPAGSLRYQRTPSRGEVSEAVLMDYLRRNIFRFMAQRPDLPIVRIIQKQQEKSAFEADSWAC